MEQALFSFCNKLELHYYFNDRSRYIDAIIRHRCEKEILVFIRSVAQYLDVNLTIYVERQQKQSGYTDVWSIAGENPRAISIVVNSVIHILSHSMQPEIMNDPQSEIIMDKLLQSFRRELRKKKSFAPMPSELLDILCSNNRFSRCRSNFYEAIKGYPKVSKITLRELNQSNLSRSGMVEIKRDRFDTFILQMDDLPLLTDKKASIQIISPVLGNVRLRWRGIYLKTKELIDFNMADDEFREQLVSKEVMFTAGFCIDCVLEISQKNTPTGIINVGYNVKTVIRTRLGRTETVTPQGKRHLREVDAQKRQLSLNFFD